MDKQKSQCKLIFVCIVSVWVSWVLLCYYGYVEKIKFYEEIDICNNKSISVPNEDDITKLYIRVYIMNHEYTCEWKVSYLCCTRANGIACERISKNKNNKQNIIKIIMYRIYINIKKKEVFRQQYRILLYSDTYIYISMKSWPER